MNNVSLEGRLTKDPELKGTEEKPVCDMRLAVNGPGNTPTCFIDVAAFGELATDTAELAKGQAIKVEGALRYSEWQTKTEPPQRRSRHSIVAREVAVTGHHGSRRSIRMSIVHYAPDLYESALPTEGSAPAPVEPAAGETPTGSARRHP